MTAGAGERGADRWLVLALLAGVAVLWTAGFSTSRFVRPDALDYAQMGREIREGHGFSTLQILPRHAAWLDAHGRLDDARWPNLHRYPLPTLLDAGAQLFVADPVRAAVLQCGVCFVAAAGVLFGLARSLADRATAVLAVLLFAGDPLLVESAYNGMSESVSVLIVLAALWGALVGPLSTPRALAVGALCGFGFLARSQLALLLPAACAAVAARAGPGARGRALALLWVLAAALVVASPWLLRNAQLTGDPVFSFSSSRNLLKRVRADADLDLHAPVATGAILARHGGDVLAKLGRDTAERLPSPRYWLDSLGPVGGGGLLVVLASLPLRSHGRRYRGFRAGLLAAIAANFALLSLTFHSERFWAVLRPLLFLAGAAEASDLLQRLAGRARLRRAPAVGLSALALLAAARLAATAADHLRRPPPPAAERAGFALLAERTPTDAVIVSDVSHQIACYAQRRAIRLPQRPGQLFELDALRPVDYVLFGPRLGKEAYDLRGLPAGARAYRRYAGFPESARFRERFAAAGRLPNGARLFARRDAALRPPGVESTP